MLILFLALFYSEKNIYLLLLYSKHVIKLLGYNFGCYNWITITEKKVVSTHPPLEEITIIAQGSKIIVSPFKKINPKEDENRNSNLKDIKGPQQQNNLTNQILRTISSQLDRIKKNFLKSKDLSEQEKSLFKSPEFTKPIKLGNKNNDLIKILAKKLEALNLTSTNPSSSKRQLNILSGSEIYSSLEEAKTNILDQENDQINRICYQKTWQQRTRNFFPKPTSPDL